MAKFAFRCGNSLRFRLRFKKSLAIAVAMPWCTWVQSWGCRKQVWGRFRFDRPSKPSGRGSDFLKYNCSNPSPAREKMRQLGQCLVVGKHHCPEGSPLFLAQPVPRVVKHNRRNLKKQRRKKSAPHTKFAHGNWAPDRAGARGGTSASSLPNCCACV